MRPILKRPVSPKYEQNHIIISLEAIYHTAYALSTLENSKPRVRHCIHRAFLSPTPNLPLLIGTTDARSPKASQIDVNDNVELAWWIADANEQYRIQAKAHIFTDASHPLYNKFPISRFAENATNVINWEKERVTSYNDRMGGVLRASFFRPVPGSPLVGGYEAGNTWPASLPKSYEVQFGSKESTQVEAALKNFALLVLEPYGVERLELGVTPNRRTCWTLVDGEWKEEIVVP